MNKFKTCNWISGTTHMAVPTGVISYTNGDCVSITEDCPNGRVIGKSSSGLSKDILRFSSVFTDKLAMLPFVASCAYAYNEAARSAEFFNDMTGNDFGEFAIFTTDARTAFCEVEVNLDCIDFINEIIRYDIHAESRFGLLCDLEKDSVGGSAIFRSVLDAESDAVGALYKDENENAKLFVIVTHVYVKLICFDTCTVYKLDYAKYLVEGSAALGALLPPMESLLMAYAGYHKFADGHVAYFGDLAPRQVTIDVCSSCSGSLYTRYANRFGECSDIDYAGRIRRAIRDRDIARFESVVNSVNAKDYQIVFNAIDRSLPIVRDSSLLYSMLDIILHQEYSASEVLGFVRMMYPALAGLRVYPSVSCSDVLTEIERAVDA